MRLPPGKPDTHQEKKRRRNTGRENIYNTATIERNTQRMLVPRERKKRRKKEKQNGIFNMKTHHTAKIEQITRHEQTKKNAKKHPDTTNRDGTQNARRYKTRRRLGRRTTTRTKQSPGEHGSKKEDRNLVDRKLRRMRTPTNQKAARL